jgi:hypothetical protein
VYRDRYDLLRIKHDAMSISAPSSWPVRLSRCAPRRDRLLTSSPALSGLACRAEARFRDCSGGRRLVGLTRFELVTPRLSSVCSNQLSYRPGILSSKNHGISRLPLPVLSKLDSPCAHFPEPNRPAEAGRRSTHRSGSNNKEPDRSSNVRLPPPSHLTMLRRGFGEITLERR